MQGEDKGNARGKTTAISSSAAVWNCADNTKSYELGPSDSSFLSRQSVVNSGQGPADWFISARWIDPTDEIPRMGLKKDPPARLRTAPCASGSKEAVKDLES